MYLKVNICMETGNSNRILIYSYFIIFVRYSAMDTPEKMPINWSINMLISDLETN